jgi:hypothetical protein
MCRILNVALDTVIRQMGPTPVRCRTAPQRSSMEFAKVGPENAAAGGCDATGPVTSFANKDAICFGKSQNLTSTLPATWPSTMYLGNRLRTLLRAISRGSAPIC